MSPSWVPVNSARWYTHFHWEFTFPCRKTFTSTCGSVLGFSSWIFAPVNCASTACESAFRNSSSNSWRYCLSYVAKPVMWRSDLGPFRWLTGGYAGLSLYPTPLSGVIADGRVLHGAPVGTVQSNVKAIAPQIDALPHNFRVIRP